MRETSEVPVEEQWKNEVLLLVRLALKTVSQDGDREPVLNQARNIRRSFASFPWVQTRAGLSDEEFVRDLMQEAKQWIERA